jgi:Tfp pilus assembly ATPase PilU
MFLMKKIISKISSVKKSNLNTVSQNKILYIINSKKNQHFYSYTRHKNYAVRNNDCAKINFH